LAIDEDSEEKSKEQSDEESEEESSSSEEDQFKNGPSFGETLQTPSIATPSPNINSLGQS